MRLLIYLNIGVCCLLLLPQYKAQTYFNKIYDCYNNGDLSTAIDTLNNEYVTLGVGFNPPLYGFSWGFNLKKYDLLSGTELYTKTYFHNGNNYVPQSSKPIHNKGRLIVTGEKVYSGSNSWAFFWRFNSALDSVDYKEFGFANRANSIWSSIKTNDNTIYLVGYTDSSSTNGDVLLIKTDTAGNEVWKKKIGVVGWDEQAYAIDTIQGKLLVSGNRTMHSTSITEGFVMLMDTAANIIWQKTVYTNGGYGGCVAKTLKDGNILVYSRIKKYSIGSDDYYKLQCEKIDINNVSFWQKEYNVPGNQSAPYSATENKQGNIVIVGQMGLSFNTCNGILNEITQNGDSIFSREYYYQQGCQNYFRDIIQSSDGGYCLAGFFIPTYANGCTGSQDIWLLKIDSTFCEGSFNCGYPTGVHGQSAELNGIKVYPNPATNTLLLLNTIKGANKAKFKLYQANGTEVLQADVLPNYQEQSINISHLAAGVYYYQILADSQSIGYQKLVIIK